MAGREQLFTINVDKNLNITSVAPDTIRFRPLKKKEGQALERVFHPDYAPEMTGLIKGLSAGEFTKPVIIGRVSEKFYYLNMTARSSEKGWELSFSVNSRITEPCVYADSDSLSRMTQELLGVFYRSDRFGNLIYFSDGMTGLLGYDPDEMIGSSLKKELFSDSMRYEGMKSTMLADGSIRELEAALKHKNGQIVWVSVSSTPVYSDEGEYLGAAGYAKDITKQKNSEEELAHSRRLLELKQKELDSMTVSMKYRVQSQVSKGRREEESILYHARLAEMGEMVGSIAHQWRQPLSALMFLIEDIRDAYHFGELDTDYLDRSIDESMAYIRFMSETMDDFRNFFRPEPDKEQFNVVEKLLEVVKMQYGRFEVGAVNVRIKCETPAGEPDELLFLEYGKGIRSLNSEIRSEVGIVAYGYPNLFKQIWINLINNSIDSILEKRARNDMGATESGLLVLSISTNDRKIYLSIEDNGTGIEESSLERIFEPEYTTKPKNQGTGIGLHMAKSIVEKSLGGKIRAGNTGTGAQFIIEIPLVAVTVR